MRNSNRKEGNLMAVMCPYFPEVQVGYTCDKGADLRNGQDCTEKGMRTCPSVEWTCEGCGKKETCEFAFDFYCTDGECLADEEIDEGN
jgi:hypothetical protein